MKVNANHFHDDTARQAYIESRLGGKASRELAPYLRDTHPEPINTSTRLLAHLWENYHDPNLAEKSLDDYNKLKMKPGDEFNTFKNDFVRLASECGKTRAQWKAELKRKLTTDLQRQLAAAYVDPTVTFDQFVRLGSEIALVNKQAKEEAATRRQNEPATRPSAGRANPAKAVANSNGRSPAAGYGGTAPTGLTPDIVRKLYKEGRYFHCREKGHLSKDCPQKPPKPAVPTANPRDREARIQEI